jgi:hypothetical protein
VCSDLYGFAAAVRLFSTKTWRASEEDALTDAFTNIDFHSGGGNGNTMKRYMRAILIAVVLMGSSMAAFAGSVRTDYDHTVNFSKYNTYSWGKVQTSNPFFVNRIQQAVDKELQAKGWQLNATGGSVTVFATDNIHDQQEVQTMYDNMGSGWGGGWGWGGWGWGGGWGWANPGFGTGIATTTTVDHNIGNLVIDFFDGNSKRLLWRGLATENLSSNADKNTRMVDDDIKNMFKNFPPKAGK